MKTLINLLSAVLLLTSCVLLTSCAVPYGAYGRIHSNTASINFVNGISYSFNQGKHYQLLLTDDPFISCMNVQNRLEYKEGFNYLIITLIGASSGVYTVKASTDTNTASAFLRFYPREDIVFDSGTMDIVFDKSGIKINNLRWITNGNIFRGVLRTYNCPTL